MLSHSLQRGVLILTVYDEPVDYVDNALAQNISDLVHAHDPAPVVIVLEADVAAPVIEAVVRAHLMCSELGVLVSVATRSASARRVLEGGGNAAGPRLVVHARTDTAIATAYAIVA